MCTEQSINRKNLHAVDVWSDHLKSFGLRVLWDYDLPTGKVSQIPKRTNNVPNGGWKYHNHINSIGQVKS
jgi:penicillin-binding protein 2